MRGNISVVKRHIENYSYTFMATIDPIENKLLNDDRWEYGKMKDSCNIIERRGLSNNNEGDCYKAKKGIYYDGNLIRNVGWPK